MRKSNYSPLALRTVMSLISIFIFLFFFYLPIINAQIKHTCGSDILHQELIETNPGYLERHTEINNKIYLEAIHSLKYKSSNRANMPSYVIPVVVHIITPPGTPVGSGNNLTEQQIEDGLEFLNEAFANSGSFNTANGVDVGISFCLAKRDPNGQPTNGITRTESNLVTDPTCAPFGTNMNNGGAIKALISWDCSQYLNVWLVTDLYNDFFGCSLAGFATFPGAGCNADGVMQESQYWLTKSGATISTHEVGHYFSLHHTFNGGCINDDCLLDGDKVCDTPPDGSPSFAACNTNSCSTDSPDLLDDNTNYMDYTSCTPPHFTSGQRDRMISGLENGRKTLISSLGCLPVATLDAYLKNFSSLSNGCGNAFCSRVTIKNTGAATLTSFQVQIKVDNIIVQSFPWSGSLASNSEITYDLPCFNITLGKHTIEAIIINPNGGTDQYIVNNSQIINYQGNVKPDLTIESIDSTHCGNDGQLKVKVTNGIQLYQYIIDVPKSKPQLSPIFYDLKNQVYNVIVIDTSGCRDTLTTAIPDICPPCINGVINHYAAIQSFCDSATLYVDDVTGFAPGDIVLIYQAKGATIDSTNTASFGNILNYGNAGNYEYNLIIKIEGNKVTLKFKLLKSYDIPGRTQMVDIPWLGDATVCNLTSAPWDGFKGGILIFEAEDLNIVGNIDVSGKGFRGGIAQNAEISNPPFNNFFSNSYVNGASKGEGIDILQGSQFKYAKGNRANGGGGGNDRKAGGAGGGNFGSGGMGGMGFQPTFFTGIQGISGLGLDYSKLPNKIFFGGGGGAGHSTLNYCSSGTDGGNGGGIVIVNAQTLIQNSSKILANGISALDPFIGAACDGAGGGGAGGVILIHTTTLPVNLKTDAHGGDGGNVYGQQYYLGPGGGGGGGVILSTNPITFLTSVAGGANGFYNGFNDYGATPGENGFTLGNIILPIAYVPYAPIGNVSVKIDTFCFGSGFMEVKITKGSEVPEFKLDEGNWQTNGFFEAIDTGIHNLSIRTKCVQFDTLIKLSWPAGLKDSLLFLTAVNCAYNGQIGVIGLDGTPPYSYKINNGPPQMVGVFKNLIPGDYTISIIDSKGCQINKVYTINDFDKMLNLVIDSMDLLINCGDSSTFISVHAEGTYPYYYYSLDNGPTEPIGFFDSLTVGNHSIIGYDEYGCVSQKLDFNVVKAGNDIATTNSIELCEGESVTVGNNTYILSGNYMDTLTTFEGCDSIIITQLTVHPIYIVNNSLEICSGDSIKVGNNVYKSSGFYVDIFKTVFGCDSTINTNLQVVPFKTNNQQLSICPGESIKVGNNIYNLEGVYKDTLISISGCDSLINTTLTVIPVNNNLQQLFLCSGDEVIVGNNIYNTEGKFIDTLISYNGCDSILTTIIYLLNSSSSMHQFTICPGTFVTVNNKIYNDEGIFKDTLINAVGCDSILNIQINFDNVILNQIDFNLCPGDTFKVNNKTYSAVGIYSDTLISQLGCDSILVINIIDQATNLCDSVDCLVYLPNVFSPNADGINDYFEAFVNKVIINDMEIYDRWGELVIKITSPAPRWYGKSSSGKLMHQGVYIYIIRGLCSDGSPYYRHGDVTLMR